MFYMSAIYRCYTIITTYISAKNHFPSILSQQGLKIRLILHLRKCHNHHTYLKASTNISYHAMSAI